VVMVSKHVEDSTGCLETVERLPHSPDLAGIMGLVHVVACQGNYVTGNPGCLLHCFLNVIPSLIRPVVEIREMKDAESIKGFRKAWQIDSVPVDLEVQPFNEDRVGAEKNGASSGNHSGLHELTTGEDHCCLGARLLSFLFSGSDGKGLHQQHSGFTGQDVSSHQLGTGEQAEDRIRHVFGIADTLEG